MFPKEIPLRCFILGGGETLTKLNFLFLREEYTIGVNCTFRNYPTNVLYSMDYEFYMRVIQQRVFKDEKENEEVAKKFLNFQGEKYLLNPNIPNLEKKFKLVNRIYSPEINFTNFNRGIYAGSNSGFGAIMLACLLGFKKIFLLGYDLRVGIGTHWHGGYWKQDRNKFVRRLEKFRKEFEEWAPRFKEVGVQIVQLVFRSEKETDLRCFGIQKLGEVL